MTEENALYEKELRDKLNGSSTLDENEMALKDRLNGRLTTLDIDGHTFYVDFPMKAIRPKDDFSTLGIKFDELHYRFNDELGRCEIPYHRKKHEMVALNLNYITEIPKDIIVIAFPTPKEMDPVGYARAKGWPIEEIIKDIPQKSHFTALILKGENNYLEKRVNENRQNRNLPPLSSKKKSRKMGR